MIRDALLTVFYAAGAIGCLYLIVAAAMVTGFARRRIPALRSGPAVTILKPLHGDEPGLFANLASFCEQDYAGPVQIVCGVTDANDTAIAVVERLRAAFPACRIDIVIDTRIAASNPKVANLINMSAKIAHDIVILSDGDIRIGGSDLAKIVGAQQASGGALTCPYYGIAAESVWAELSRLSIDSHFLPGVIAGVQLGLTRPCFGSVIAMRRESLDAIGGFAAVADCLADDYELGAALRRHGNAVEVLPLAVSHQCNEASFRQLWRHELRWALTIRQINPVGYAGSIISHAVPLALGAVCVGGGIPALVLLLAALACRLGLLMAVERAYALTAHSYWLVPLRDLLSFAIFISGFLARGVDWKGHRFTRVSEGMLVSERRSPLP